MLLNRRMIAGVAVALALSGLWIWAASISLMPPAGAQSVVPLPTPWTYGVTLDKDACLRLGYRWGENPSGCDTQSAGTVAAKSLGVWELSPNISVMSAGPGRLSTSTFSSNQGPYLTVTSGGEVQIDWAKTEAAANGQDDNFARVVAQALLAVRGGTSKPLP